MKLKQFLAEVKEIYYNPNLVNMNIYIHRMNTCRDCSELKHNFCQQCGCLMTLKAQFEKMNCALKKW